MLVILPRLDCTQVETWASYTANEGPVRIRYKCLVPIYVFPEMKLLFPKQNCNVLSPKFIHSYIYKRFIYFRDLSAYSSVGKYGGAILAIYKSLTDT
jgi:hypothetical protein